MRSDRPRGVPWRLAGGQGARLPRSGMPLAHREDDQVGGGHFDKGESARVIAGPRWRRTTPRHRSGAALGHTVTRPGRQRSGRRREAFPRNHQRRDAECENDGHAQLDRAIAIVCARMPAAPLCESAGALTFRSSHLNLVTGTIHPPPAPSGDGERINLFRALAPGERVGNAGPDLCRSPMKRLLSCAISAMRRSWRVRYAKP
jgi:hypothetical protein